MALFCHYLRITGNLLILNKNVEGNSFVFAYNGFQRVYVNQANKKVCKDIEMFKFLNYIEKFHSTKVIRQEYSQSSFSNQFHEI